MIPKLLITFLTGILAGFLLHKYVIVGGSGKTGGTSTVEVAKAETAPPRPAPPWVPSPPARESDGETGLLLRQFFANRPAQFDTIQAERDAAMAELFQLSTELLLSYGTMDQAGATVGGLLRRIMEFENLDEADIDDEEHRALVKDMVSLVAMSDAIRELDADPTEAALYQSAVLQEVASLSEESASWVRTVLEQAYVDAGALGLNYAARPDESDAFDQWNARRAATYGEVLVNLQSNLLPAEIESLDAFNKSNGFLSWKLVDPFDPAVFIQPEEYTGRSAAADPVEGIAQ